MTRPAPALGPIISLRGSGVVLLLTLALTDVAPLLRRNGRAGYLDVALGVVSVGALVAAGALAVRGRPRDWRAAAGVAAAAGAGYVISRLIGWPGASGDVDRWSSPAGSAALATAIATFTLATVARHRFPTAAGRPPGPAPDAPVPPGPAASCPVAPVPAAPAAPGAEPRATDPVRARSFSTAREKGRSA